MIDTGTVSAAIVAVARLIIYGVSFYSAKFSLLSVETGGLVLAARLAALLGAFFGA